MTLAALRIRELRYFSSHAIGGASADAALYLWLCDVALDALDPLRWFDTGAFYPYGLSLAFSDNFILPAVAVRGFEQLGLGRVAAYNLMMLGALWLLAQLTFAFVMRLGAAPLPSFTAGLTAMTLPYLSGVAGHPQLQMAFLFPALLLLLIELLYAPTPRNGAFFGLGVWCAFLCTVHFAVMGVFLSIVLAGALLLLGAWIPTPRQCARAVVGTVLGLVPLIPFAWPYLLVQDAFGARRLYEAHYFSAHALSWISTSEFGGMFPATTLLSHSEAHLWPGCALVLAALALLITTARAPLQRAWLGSVLLALSVSAFSLFPREPAQVVLIRYGLSATLWCSIVAMCVALYRGRRSLDAIPSALLATAWVAACMTFGPLGNPEKGHLAFSPFVAASGTVPGLGGLRAVSRFGLPALLLLLIAITLRGASLLAIRGPVRGAFVCILIGLCAALESTVPMRPLEPFFALKISRTPDESPAIVLPYAGALNEQGQPLSGTEFARLQTAAMLTFGTHDRPLVNGYSGIITKIIREYPRLLKGFPGTRALDALRSIGGLTTYIAPEDVEPLPEPLRITRRAEGYVFIADDGTLTVTKERRVVLPPWPGASVFYSLETAPGVEHVLAELDLYGGAAERIALVPGRHRSIVLPDFGLRVRPLYLTFPHIEESAHLRIERISRRR